MHSVIIALHIRVCVKGGVLFKILCFYSKHRVTVVRLAHLALLEPLDLLVLLDLLALLERLVTVERP